MQHYGQKIPGKHNFFCVHGKAGETTFSKIKVGGQFFIANFRYDKGEPKYLGNFALPKFFTIELGLYL